MSKKPIYHKSLDEYLAERMANYDPEPFKPCARYNYDGDQLEVYWSEERYYGVELTGCGMCLHMSETEEGKVIGATIYNIKSIVEKAGGFRK